jgi:hypothetical protein
VTTGEPDGGLVSAINALDHVTWTPHDIDVPHAVDTIASALEPTRALGISIHVFFFSVPSSILFYDQLR